MLFGKFYDKMYVPLATVKCYIISLRYLDLQACIISLIYSIDCVKGVRTNKGTLKDENCNQICRKSNCNLR